MHPCGIKNAIMCNYLPLHFLQHLNANFYCEIKTGRQENACSGIIGANVCGLVAAWAKSVLQQTSRHVHNSNVYAAPPFTQILQKYANKLK